MRIRLGQPDTLHEEIEQAKLNPPKPVVSKVEAKTPAVDVFDNGLNSFVRPERKKKEVVINTPPSE